MKFRLIRLDADNLPKGAFAALTIVNVFIKSVYIFLAAIPLVYAAVALYSYYAVRYTFGTVGSEDVLADLARATDKSVRLLLADTGGQLVTALIFFVPVTYLWVILNSLLHLVCQPVGMQKKWAIVLFIEILLIVFLIVIACEPFSWYLGYILD
jgi:hypothetical protein